MKKMFQNNFTLLKYVWRFSPETVIWRVITVSLNIVVDATLNVLFLQTVVDSISEGLGLDHILKYIIIVTLIMFANDFSNALYSQYIEPVGKQKIHKGMHTMIFSKVRKLDLERFDDADFYNDYIWALKEVDTRTMKSFVMLSNFYKAVVSSGVFVVISVRFDWRFLGFVLVPVIIRLAMSDYKSRMNYKLYLELNPVNRKKDYARRTFYLREYAKEIKTYPVGDVLMKIFSDSVDENIGIVKRYRNRFVAATNLETSTYWLFGKMPITIYMCYLVMITETLSLGAFVAMYSAASKLMYSIASIFTIVPTMRENGLFAEKILNLLNCEGKIEEDESGEPFSGSLHTLQLGNVSFKYPFNEKKILDDVSITVRRGEKIAIVGLNGAGKTTLIKLLLRLYDPTEGSILLNGTDIKTYRIRDYRKLFSAVFQDFQLYAVSLRENLLMGECGETDDEKLKAVLEEADMTEFKGLLDRNLTKEFDRNGIICSGGQRQKVAIVRAVLKSSDLMVLDEASSALDPIAEDRIRKLIMDSRKSVVFISHRLSSIQDLDRIYFMENGRVAEYGSHEELMRRDGKYAQMYRLQAEKYRLDQRESEL